MPKATAVPTTSRRSLLSRSAVLAFAGTATACVPNLAPAAEPGANPELIRLVSEARAARAEENRLWDKTDAPDTARQIALEEYYQPKIIACSDLCAEALYAAGDIPLRTPADVRLAARAVLEFGELRDGDGYFDRANFLNELGWLTLSIVEAMAGVEHGAAAEFEA